MNIKRDIELLFEIGSFRLLQRTWKRFLAPGAANNSEHTLRVIWIALTLSKYEEGVNEEKLLKMALVHDLSESRCGDVDYVSRLYTDRKEERAIEDTIKGTSHDKEMIDLWKEYEERKSIEAKIVKDADNLDVEFELQEMKESGGTLKDVWKEKRRDKVYPKLFTSSAKKFWDEIEKTNVHSWHLMGRNRFNDGDWNVTD